MATWMKKILLLSAVLPLMVGCAYTPKVIIPPHIKRIDIPIFANKTFRYGLEERLTEGVIQAFIIDGRLIVARSGKADAKLEGEIISYSKEPLRYDDEGYVSEYKIWIRTSLLFYDLIHKEALWSDELEESVTYIPEASFLVDKGFSPETEDEAEDRLLKKLSIRIASRTIDGW
ncbi:TPA: hypothetical protein DCX15_01785 [bacterium]|nr:hypothetical protein [bacterium]